MCLQRTLLLVRHKVNMLRHMLFSSLPLQQTAGPNQLLVDLTDPNRPRFTMQELKEVLQERNQLKAQLMVAQEELQLYRRSGAFHYKKSRSSEKYASQFLIKCFKMCWLNSTFCTFPLFNKKLFKNIYIWIDYQSNWGLSFCWSIAPNQS